MPTFHRASEITYYDELGLNPDASAEEIRDTFRALARLLHPDQQIDPLLKDTAEKQMRKLNRIYAVLSDPERRRRYDESLDGNYAPILVTPAIPSQVALLKGRLAWIGAIVASSAFLIWLAIWSTPSGPAITRSFPHPEMVSRASTPSPQNRVEELQSQLRTAISERDAAVREVKRLRAESQSAFSRSPESGPPPPAAATSIGELKGVESVVSRPSAGPVTMSTPPAIAMTLPAPSRIEAPPLPALRRRLTGFWFYVKPPQGQRNKNQALYVPEYMEATINEVNGTVAGSYRSRYQINDRAMSPEVNFTFNCPSAPSGSDVNCSWLGAGGAKGELTLHLNSDNAMRLDWTATELGTVQGLISGTAVLTRRIDPAN